MQIPFKVSARTARLIGRENVANAEGALIELVKNAYDADASVCIIYVVTAWTDVPEQLTESQYVFHIRRIIALSIPSETYELSQDENCYCLNKERLDVQQFNLLQDYFKKQRRIYVIDNGEGMSESIIKNCWMTIGTNNKQANYLSKKKRIRVGEKGIGRFALDRLGSRCYMVTKPDQSTHQVPADVSAYRWSVKWEDFDSPNKVLEEITAKLIEKPNFNLNNRIAKVLPDTKAVNELIGKHTFNSGTFIKISFLRDEWDSHSINRLFKNLEQLNPPREGSNFNISLFWDKDIDGYGEVTGSVCDDYDYKLEATADEAGEVNVTITRREYNLIKLPESLFQRDKMKHFPYDKGTFQTGSYELKRTLRELLPGFYDSNSIDVLKRIGTFNFVLYFMKKQVTKEDAKKYFYRDFNSATRQKWLDSFGGIKIYRDNFRIRPYGEKGSNSEDWLGLGERAAASPAGIGKQSGGYKVRPYNLAGSIHISRTENLFFEDKSSREGFQETQEFDVFKQLLIEIVALFEDDRSYIAREMSAIYAETNYDEIVRKRAEEIAERIRTKRESSNETHEDPEKEILAAHTQHQQEIIEELRNEQKLLRALASAGAITASFAHELQNLNGKLVYRFEELKDLLADYIDATALTGVPDYENPYVFIDDIQKQDERLKHWLNFSINSVRKDKRRRKSINILSYFDDFRVSWNAALATRKVDLNIASTNSSSLQQRFFEIDLDIIFNNLLVNSLDVFMLKNAPANRAVNINVTQDDNHFYIQYDDSGPGLSVDIIDPDQIFECFYTTKRHPKTGEKIGTGIGMWLVKSVVEDNDGTVTFTNLRPGFGIKIKFPKKFKRG